MLPKWRDIGHRAAVAHEMECIAYILVKKKHPEWAVTLLGAADAMRKMIDSVPTPLEKVEYDKEMASLRAKMEETEFGTRWREGQKLTIDEAMALAIRED